MYILEEPQDVVRLDISFHRGDERTRAFSVTTYNLEGDSSSTFGFTSSGTTNGYEEFQLNAADVYELHITPIDPNSHDWFSITEVITACIAIGQLCTAHFA